MGLGSVFTSRVVGRWGLSAAGGVGGGGGGLEVEDGFDSGRGGGRTRGDRGGRSSLSTATGGGGGGRGGVRGGGESRDSGFRTSSAELLLVSGRLWVRLLALGSILADSAGAAGLDITSSVRAGASDGAVEITDEPPAAEGKSKSFAASVQKYDSVLISNHCTSFH